MSDPTTSSRARPESPATPASDDLALAQRARAGDMRAFEDLVARYGQMVFSLCYASVLDHSAAEDLSQDVFFAAWRGLKRFRADAAFSTWLYAIARNVCVDASRRRSARPATLRFEDQRGVPDVLEASRGASAELLALVGQLSPALRQALLLREIQGLSYEEIAALQCVPIGTVRSRISSARGFVADRLRA